MERIVIRALIISISLAALVACTTTRENLTPGVDEPLHTRSENLRLRMFFGLSKPGGGIVSSSEWALFQRNVIAKQFDGFNVVDSVGFFEGRSEQSKILTLIMNKNEIPKAEKIATMYAQRFDQESVMMVVVPVLQWKFIGK